MSITFTTTRSFFWLAVSFRLPAIIWALTPPIEIYSNRNTLTNSSADHPISLQAQSNLSTVANQTTFQSLTAPTSFPNPPVPVVLTLEGTPYSIQFINFKEELLFFDVLDLLSEVQYDIMREMAATFPSQDRSIGQTRAWTSDKVTLSINTDNYRIVHSVCGLYVAAMVKVWGYKYGFNEAELEFLRTFGPESPPEIIGKARLIGVGGTTES